MRFCKDYSFLVSVFLLSSACFFAYGGDVVFGVYWGLFSSGRMVVLLILQSRRRTTTRSLKIQHARGCTAADIFTNCVYKIPVPKDGGPIPFFVASQPSLPAAWLARLLTKVGNVESNHGPTTHIQTHNTHWVNLKYTQIRQRHIVILQININDIKNKIEEIKNSEHST